MLPAFEEINASGRGGCLLVCDHASRAIPPALGTLGLPEARTREHIAWDIGAAALTRGLAAALDVPAILAAWSRLVVDCNRQLDHDEAFVQKSAGVAVPGNATLTDEDRAWRIATFYDPYHAAIGHRLDAMTAAGPEPALVSIHSFTPVWQGRPRRWHAGILWDRDDRLAAPLLASLRSPGDVLVGDNEPYSGRHPTGHTCWTHGAQRGLRHVAIEVRQDELADESGIRDWVTRLAPALASALAGGPA